MLYSKKYLKYSLKLKQLGGGNLGNQNRLLEILTYAAASGFREVTPFLNLNNQFRADGQLLSIMKNVKYSNNKTILMYAANIGNLGRVQFLLDRGANINDSDSNGYTPLIYACINGNVDIVRLLLDRGANQNATVNIINNDMDDHGGGEDQDGNAGKNVLMIAAQYNRLAIFELLIQRGANYEQILTSEEYISNRGQNIIQIAIANNSNDVADHLIGLGVNINNLLSFAATHRNLHIVNRLCMLDSVTRTQNYAQAFLEAINSRSLDIITVLIGTGVPLNISNGLYEISNIAREYTNDVYIPMAQFLLTHGAEVNYTFNNSTPLINAVFSGNIPMINLLLAQHNIQVDLKSTRYNTALFQALRKNTPNIAQLLISSGANINLYPEDILDFLNYQGNPIMLQFIIEHVSLQTLNYTIPDPFGTYDRNILNIAIRRNWSIDLIDCIIKRGAILNNKFNPLMVAIVSNSLPVIEYLVRNTTININSSTPIGMNILTLALYHGNIKIIQFLRRCPGIQIQSNWRTFLSAEKLSILEPIMSQAP